MINEIVKGKRVIVVGAGRSATQNWPGSVDEYDVVVRLNDGWPTLEKHLKTLGKRCDIMYHCVVKHQHFEKMLNHPESKQIKCLCYLKPSTSHQSIIDKITKLLDNCKIPKITMDDYQSAMPLQKKPNIGTLAIFHLLEHDLKELKITGINFWREPYYTGYPESSFANETEVKKTSSQKHDADEQIALFVQKMKQDNRIQVDYFLHQILLEENLL